MSGRRKNAPIEEIEALFNIAKNKLKLTEVQLCEIIGITPQMATWRKAGFGPAWYPWAIKGLLAERATETNGDNKPVRTGFHFTTEQLEVLNNALFKLGPNELQYREPVRKMRSQILLELAPRLDG